ncbi:hypothetical protein ACFC4G_16675 [Streptomyces sp. NPDC056002]|uniref:hypothetical protein n=1 Tax=Streptomyces sp. NPDC056002 TaxID=3345675 RepID=UPI0035DB572C
MRGTAAMSPTPLSETGWGHRPTVRRYQFGPPPPYVPCTPATRTVASPLLPMLLATGVPVRSVTRHRAITVVRA